MAGRVGVRLAVVLFSEIIFIVVFVLVRMSAFVVSPFFLRCSDIMRWFRVFVAVTYSSRRRSYAFICSSIGATCSKSLVCMYLVNRIVYFVDVYSSCTLCGLFGCEFMPLNIIIGNSSFFAACMVIIWIASTSVLGSIVSAIWAVFLPCCAVYVKYARSLLCSVFDHVWVWSTTNRSCCYWSCVWGLVAAIFSMRWSATIASSILLGVIQCVSRCNRRKYVSSSLTGCAVRLFGIGVRMLNELLSRFYVYRSSSL